MHSVALHSNWDSFLVAIPFLLILLPGFLHWDAKADARTGGSQRKGEQLALFPLPARQWRRNSRQS
jgi:hypothetical protein